MALRTPGDRGGRRPLLVPSLIFVVVGLLGKQGRAFAEFQYGAVVHSDIVVHDHGFVSLRA